MKWIDFKAGFRDFWNEFKRVKFGLFGLILLFIFILAILINPYIVPFPEASSRWRDITYWEANIPMIFLLWILYFMVIL
jgi:peptide/nickel transport system permease protein